MEGEFQFGDVAMNQVSEGWSFLERLPDVLMRLDNQGHVQGGRKLYQPIAVKTVFIERGQVVFLREQ